MEFIKALDLLIHHAKLKKIVFIGLIKLIHPTQVNKLFNLITKMQTISLDLEFKMAAMTCHFEKQFIIFIIHYV